MIILISIQMFLSSPRNTMDAHLNLLKSLQCNSFLVPHSPLPIVKSLLSQRPMRLLLLPDLDYWLDDVDVASYPYKRSMAEACHDPFVVLHSSGSTGVPKPVVLRHGTMAALDAFHLLPSLGAKPWHGHHWEDKRVFVSFPLFHAAGISFLLPICIYFRITAVLPPASGPLTADVVNSVHSNAKVRMGLYPPSILVDIAKNPTFLDNLRHLKHVSFGGGPLPKDIGDLISTKTQISACFGTTEAAFYPTEIPEPGDWEYFSFSPLLGQEFRHVEGDLYEHVLVRNRNPDLSIFQGIFFTFPDLEEFATKDLYSKHPTRPGWWHYRGRIDDIIVFSNGEKLSPLAIEALIESHPAVNSALVGGHGKFQSVLLVEAVKVPSTKQERDELLHEIWPTIERANQQSPAHGQLFKDLVLFTTTVKPMLRAGKGTVQRKKTLDLYDEELDSMYTNAAAAAAEEGLVVQSPSDTSSELDKKNSLLDLVRNITALDITLTGNMFDSGLDSLKVLNLVKHINSRQIRQGQGHRIITSKTIYANPTVHDLDMTLGQVEPRSDSSKGRCLRMQKYFAQYESDLPVNARETVDSSGQSLVVLLTGSTGSLGSYLLNVITQDSSISRVYCLNRSVDAENRQRQMQTSRGLSTVFSKVEFLQYDMSKPYLGLELLVYKRILQEVTNIVHNAWEVNLNLTIDSYAAQIYGVRQLINLSSQSAKGAFIFFISSISTVMTWSVNHSGKVPEKPFDDWNLPEHMGYGESKFVAERLLSVAQEKSQVESAICRVGQIAGPLAKDGMWNKQEWIPSILASSKYLGQLPDSLGSMDTIDWIPVDVLAQIIMDLAKSHAVGKKTRDEAASVSGRGHLDSLGLPQVYHAVNPATTTWSSLVPVIRERLSIPSHPVRVTPFASWISALRRSGDSTGPEDLAARNPALKLIDFLEAIQQQAEKQVPSTVLDVEKTLRKSEAMKSLGPVNPTWMEEWIRQWGFL